VLRIIQVHANIRTNPKEGKKSKKKCAVRKRHGGAGRPKGPSQRGKHVRPISNEGLWQPGRGGIFNGKINPATKATSQPDARSWSFAEPIQVLVEVGPPNARQKAEIVMQRAGTKKRRAAIELCP